MKTVKIWFNRWFSTAYHIINLIKKDKEINFYIIGSSPNPDSVVKEACDEWCPEPGKVSDDEYIEFCYKFCITHDIDIFVPRHNQSIISKYRKSFEDIGVKILADDYQIVSQLQNKASAYNLIEKKHIGNIPDYYVIHNSEEFKKAYRSMSMKYENLCFKFTTDEGGCSFRIIDNKPPSPFRRSVNHTSIDTVIKDIETVGSRCPEIIIMPVLSGDEVSVDCLKTQQGNIMIPRFKSNTRAEYIKYDDDILNSCKDFLNKIPLECPCNIQFRYLDNVPYFLEVNTRMSGGIHMTCLASGINIPNIAVNKVLGINKPWVLNKQNIKITHIETPVLLK